MMENFFFKNLSPSCRTEVLVWLTLGNTYTALLKFSLLFDNQTLGQTHRQSDQPSNHWGRFMEINISIKTHYFRF